MRLPRISAKLRFRIRKIRIMALPLHTMRQEFPGCTGNEFLHLLRLIKAAEIFPYIRKYEKIAEVEVFFPLLLDSDSSQEVPVAASTRKIEASTGVVTAYQEPISETFPLRRTARTYFQWIPFSYVHSIVYI